MEYQSRNSVLSSVITYHENDLEMKMVINAEQVLIYTYLKGLSQHSSGQTDEN
jgi:hypothetical protein